MDQTSPEKAVEAAETSVEETPALGASVRTKFLRICIPLALLLAVPIMALFEYQTNHQAGQALRAKLRTDLVNVAAVLSESVWNLDEDRIRLILKSLSNDPDVAGATVMDAGDEELGKFGAVGGTAKGLTGEIPILYREDSGPTETIGKVRISLTDANVRAQSQTRIIRNVLLVAAVLIAVIASALIANWKTMGLPMERLLGAINQTRLGRQRQKVNWQSDDEIGTVINSFNAMQDHQDEIEHELRRS